MGTASDDLPLRAELLVTGPRTFVDAPRRFLSGVAVDAARGDRDRLAAVAESVA